MQDGSAIGVMLCVLVIALAIGTFIGAIILRAAVGLYNKLAGGASSPNSVPEPAIGKAMGITFVTCLVQIIVGFALDLITAGAMAAGAGWGANVVGQLVSMPVSLLIMAGMNSALLPTTFGRGFLVALCYLLIVLFIVIVVGVIFGGIYLLVSLTGVGPGY